MKLNFYSTKDYENEHDWTLGENKPNSKPIFKGNDGFSAYYTRDCHGPPGYGEGLAKDLNRALGALKKEIIERIER